MKICKQCNIEYEDNMKFCPECGTKLENVRNTCPNCGTEYKEGQKFCSECGYKLIDSISVQENINSNANIEELYQKGLAIYEREDDDTSPEEKEDAVRCFTLAAEASHYKAMYMLACCYNEGYGIEEDETKAFEWYSKAAENGNVDAMYELARCYNYGIGIDEDKEKKIEWYLKAAENGNVHAMYELALSYFIGRGIHKDEEIAFDWCLKAAENGNVDAMYELAKWYYSGIGIDEDEEKAFEWYLKAAEKGNVDAMLCLAECYKERDCTDLNEEKAFEWYSKAAENGNVDAIRELADMYYYGDGVEYADKDEAHRLYIKASECEIILDSELKEIGDILLKRFNDEKGALECYKKAGDEDAQKELMRFKNRTSSAEGAFQYWKTNKQQTEWLIKAADSGHVEACNELGKAYLYGLYGPLQRDIPMAVKYFTQGAEKGNLDSIYYLGYYYDYIYYLETHKRNLKKCMELYEKAAIAGHSRSQFRLAEIYDSFSFLKDSKVNAITWYKKAAEQGHRQAQYKLAQHYASGNGVEKDIFAACKWYEKATEGNSDVDTHSIDYLDKWNKQGAQYDIGCYYYYGNGVMRDIDKAESWFSKAAEDGHEESKKMLEKVKEEKAYYKEGASTNVNSVNNFAIDRCVPHVFYIKSACIEITMPDGRHKSMSCGIGGDFSGWTGTGMLLNDGRFVTARHVVEPWSFCMNGGEVDEEQLGLNIIANNGGKVVARFNAISSTGVQISFTSDQCTINRWNDKTTLVKDGKKVVIATLDNTDYAYFRSGRSEGLPFNTMLSTNLLRGTKLEVLGFPLGLGANSATDINPIYGSGIVAVNGLQNGVILTTDTNYEQGNSGGPVFKANVNGVLEVIGLVSAGAGRVTGFIVPIAAVK